MPFSRMLTAINIFNRQLILLSLCGAFSFFFLFDNRFKKRKCTNIVGEEMIKQTRRKRMQPAIRAINAGKRYLRKEGVLSVTTAELLSLREMQLKGLFNRESALKEQLRRNRSVIKAMEKKYADLSKNRDYREALAAAHAATEKLGKVQSDKKEALEAIGSIMKTKQEGLGKFGGKKPTNDIAKWIFKEAEKKSGKRIIDTLANK